MLVADLLNSCANESVAEAAVSSIGGSFARHMSSEAQDHGVSVGALAAGAVQRFAREASEREWRELLASVRGKDFPVLAGLQTILDRQRRRLDEPGIERLTRAAPLHPEANPSTALRLSAA